MVSMGILFFNQDEAKSRSSLTRQPLTLGLSSSRRPLDHALYGFTYSFRTGLGPLGAGDSCYAHRSPRSVAGRALREVLGVIT